MTRSKIFLFTNILPPYRARFLRVVNAEIKKQQSSFDIYLSKPSEPGRNWSETYNDLSVHTQKTLTFKKTWHHPHGFQEPNYIHVPVDTFSILIKNHPTHIISAEMGGRTALVALYKFFYRSTQFIVWATLSEHTEKGRSKLRTLFRKIILTLANNVIVNGQSGKRYIESLGVAPEKIKIIQQTTDFKALLAIERKSTKSPVGTASEPLRMLYSGRLIELKGILPFLKNLNTYLSEHFDFYVEVSFLGDGPLRAQIESLKCGPQLKFVFHGEVEYQALSKYYEAAHLLVLPTLSDEWGMVVPEALAAGLPVLGSIYSQAVDDLVKQGANGWRFDPLNPKSTAESLEQIQKQLKDDQWPTAQNARSSIEHLDLKRVAEKFTSLLFL